VSEVQVEAESFREAVKLVAQHWERLGEDEVAWRFVRLPAGVDGPGLVLVRAL